MKSLNAFVTPQRGYVMVGVSAVALVFIAIWLTHALNLEPCPLCMFQRLLYLLLALFTLSAALWQRARLPSGALALAAAVGGAATAGYQSWMQAFPARFLECGSGLPNNPIEHVVDWLGQLWPWMFFAWGECTSREWVMFGLSMANWSAVAFVGFGGVVGWMLYKSR